jgi:iodotyrosine deiodinase
MSLPELPDSDPSATGAPDPAVPADGFQAYAPRRLTLEQMRRRAGVVYQRMARRRSVRHFSAEPVPRELIELAIGTASTAPSGAHRQPWRFVAVSNPDIKRSIRVAAEQEEYAAYEGGRMPAAWREALAPLGTDWRKPYLETVPWIVVVFEQTHGVAADGELIKNYYVKESVGIACGMLIMALHQMGLSTLTHTPSPMGFLSRILGRPDNERPFVLLPIGYPATDAVVPVLRRKPLDEVAIWLE